MSSVSNQTIDQKMLPQSGTPLKKFSSLFFILLALACSIYSFVIGSAAMAVFSLLFLFLFLGLPIAISLGFASFAVIYFFTTDPLPDLAGKVFSGINSFPLMAIPFFVLAGNIFTTGGVAKRLINLANAFIGHLPGGLSIAAIMACALFAAISGSSPATVVAIGGIMIPAMTKFGYPKKYGVGSIATAGSLGILIPPSVPMIVYCVTVEQSVGKMFLAGIVPGIMLAAMLAFVSFWVAKKNNYPLSPKATVSEKMIAVKDSIWSLALPIVVIGGIYSGLFTPTESAAVACFIGLVVGFFIHKDLQLKDIPGILVESTKTTAMLFFIISMAMVFAHILTLERIPHELVAVIKDMDMGPIAFLLIVNLILFIAGQFMEPTAIITILGPILFPVAVALGIDPIHFGIIMIVNMEIGMITPPVGLNLYVASGITKMPLIDVTKATGPWLLATVVALVLVTFIPQISLWLPNFLYSLQ
ncbi:MAG TPA: TRAP transporter large permease subunit [Bacillus bacterium]|nr:TRAP transporter large permease subunit [Bacillus sp. (in: firmicutes)]